MVIYEVNLDIDKDVAAAFADWLKPHIDEMLEIDGFFRAQWFEVEADAEDRVSWSVRYDVYTRDDLQRYFDHHAARMRGDGLRRFEGRFRATRRILKARSLGPGEALS